jgi:hypothetical protein
MRKIFLFLLLVSTCAVAQVAPPEHRRGPEQTFLTYPEWFLVHSPAEYAEYVKDHTPTLFPFIGHTCQFWQGYGAVTRATKEYPFNFGYHVMVMVIGTSTSVEYVIRAGYETLIGRLSELAAPRRLSEEDRYGAKVAQDYVDFIRDVPWYEYDFASKLAGLWRETSLWGPDFVRKWERKYALTTEYAVKAAYGWLIKKATKAAYEEPLPVTAVVVDRVPAGLEKDLPKMSVLQPLESGSALVLLPRYDKFMYYAAGLAAKGASFREIAGNGKDAVILVSALVPAAWKADGLDARVLFEQPVLTRRQTKRVALVAPVGALAPLLNRLAADGARLEHVYDY